MSLRRLKSKLKMLWLLSRYQRKKTAGDLCLKYLLIPSRKPTRNLVVVFSAFPAVGKAAGYNYVRTLNDTQSHRLYILDDFGPGISGGSYYLGENQAFRIEELVEQLLVETEDKLGVHPQDVIAAGSSKGGFAAILFALKCNFGHAIAGAPQTKLGTYLSDHPEYLDYIMGDRTAQSRTFLDEFLYKKLTTPRRTSFAFMVSSKDHHAETHVKPFHEALLSHGFESRLEIGDFGEHTVIGQHFAGFLHSEVQRRTSK